MNSKKVLAILGSPRADGVTATMLDCSIREAEKAGYIVSKSICTKSKYPFVLDAEGVWTLECVFKKTICKKSFYCFTKVKLYFLRHLHIGLMSPPR